MCGISGSFLGILSLLFPPALTRCVPWGYYGLLSLVGMNWDPDTRFTWFYWEWPAPTDAALLCLWAALFLLVGRALFVRKGGVRDAAALSEAELVKFRRSPVWLAFVVLPIFPAILGTMNYLGNLGLLRSEWYSLWSQHTLFSSMFFLPALLGVFCAWQWRLSTRITTGTAFSPRRCRWGTCALPS